MHSKWNCLQLIATLLLCTCMASSCVSHDKLISLNANDRDPGDIRSDSLIRDSYLQHLGAYRIKPFDQLIININTFEGNTEEFLKREFSSDSEYSSRSDYEPAALYYKSHLVSDSGYIHLPLISKVYVEDKTLLEVKTMLDTAYSSYLKFASANVKLANMHVSVLGEVEAPGVYYLYNEQTTLVDAISLAGDFTDFANRKKVKLIRRTENGSQAIYLNMQRSDFIESEYFFLRPYDAIYVEPIKSKSFDVGARSVGIVLSVISTAALLANLLINASNRDK